MIFMQIYYGMTGYSPEGNMHLYIQLFISAVDPAHLYGLLGLIVAIIGLFYGIYHKKQEHIRELDRNIVDIRNKLTDQKKKHENKLYDQCSELKKKHELEGHTITVANPIAVMVNPARLIEQHPRRLRIVRPRLDCVIVIRALYIGRPGNNYTQIKAKRFQ